MRSFSHPAFIQPLAVKVEIADDGCMASTRIARALDRRRYMLMHSSNVLMF